MKRIRPDHVAIYVRWSTEEQTEGTTLDIQLEGCRHYAISQGWLPQDSLTFIDDGYSGGSTDRPALNRLRERIKAGEIDCVVVLKVDRLSRNIVDAVDLVLNEWKDTCYFKSAREPIDTGSDLGRVIFGILAMFADFERSQIRDRTQSGKTRRIADGVQLHGEAAFGYRPSAVKGQWVEDPTESQLVGRIFRMAAGGQSANAICRTLNREGLRTRAGKAWSVRGILWILHNRLYIGEAVYGRSTLRAVEAAGRPGKTVRIYKDEPTVRTATKAAPPLVPLALFEQANAQLEQNRTARRIYGSRSLSSRHLLVGLARCRCGGTLVSKQQRNRTHYFCHNGRSGRCSHSPGYIPQEIADSVVLAQFQAMYGAAAATDERLLWAAKELEADVAGLQAQRASLAGKAAALAEQESRVMRAARAGEINFKELRDLRVAIEADRAEMAQRIADLDKHIAAVTSQHGEMARRLAHLTAAERLALLSTELKRDLLRMALAGPIVMYKKKGCDLIEVDIPWAYEACPPR
jgi:site-specific DNA recombinase